MTDNGRPSEPFGIMLIHASAVVVNGVALIFLGPSDTGKSTICRLLSEFAQPLADDMVYLIPHMIGEWAIACADVCAPRGPLSETEAAALEDIPLRAIFRLYQASEPRLEHISALETCRHLTAALFEFYGSQLWDIGIKKTAFSHLAPIARLVPGYALYFDRSPQTPQMISAEIGCW